MRNNVRLLQLMAMLFCVLAVVSATSGQSLFKTHAQNVQPSYSYLAPCPSCTISTAPGVSTNPSAPSSGSSFVPSQAISPLPSIPSSSTPTPCSTTSLNSSLQTPSQAAEELPSQRPKRGTHHHDGGFLKDIFQLLLLMIELFLKVLGGGVGAPCTPSITPAASPAPSVPATSVAPVVSTAPPAPISPAATTGSANTTANPGTINGNSGVFGGGPFGNSCNPGSFYCNDHIVTGGKANTLYKCEPYNAPSVKQTCPGACKVNASGNDSC